MRWVVIVGVMMTSAISEARDWDDYVSECQVSFRPETDEFYNCVYILFVADNPESKSRRSAPSAAKTARPIYGGSAPPAYSSDSPSFSAPDSSHNDFSKYAYGQRDADSNNQPYHAGPLTITPNAYGPGIGMDQYGRPVQWQTRDGQRLNSWDSVKPNAYGLGVGMDQYGRPVYAAPGQ